MVVELNDDILPEMCWVRVGLNDVGSASWTQFSASARRIGLYRGRILSECRTSTAQNKNEEEMEKGPLQLVDQ